MSYRHSIDLLPKELIEQIQEYIDGQVIYIPKKKENMKYWGKNTDTKEVLAMRNFCIFQDYNNGITIKQLAKKYFLCEKSIQRILRQKKL